MNADPNSALARLRAATALPHHRLEIALNLTDPSLDIDRYTAILCRFHGFWRNWEQQLASLLDDEAFLAPRRRLHLLASDLAALGVPAARVASLPACPLPVLPNVAAALGSLYVLEGSTLGGRVMVKALTLRFGLSETAGCAYFAGYGTATGAMWQSFLARLAAAPPELTEPITAGAIATFETLVDWLPPRLLEPAQIDFRDGEREEGEDKDWSQENPRHPVQQQQ